MCKIYPNVQDIPKCARYTQMCKIYPNVQDIPKCARYTQCEEFEWMRNCQVLMKNSAHWSE